MTGPLEMVGAADAPVCVDGVCAVPQVVQGLDAPTADGTPHDEV